MTSPLLNSNGNIRWDTLSCGDENDTNPFVRRSVLSKLISCSYCKKHDEPLSST